MAAPTIVSAETAPAPYYGIIVTLAESPEDSGVGAVLWLRRQGQSTIYSVRLTGHFRAFLLGTAQRPPVINDGGPSSGLDDLTRAILLANDTNPVELIASGDAPTPLTGSWSSSAGYAAAPMTGDIDAQNSAYPGPGAPKVTHIDQGNRQVTVYFVAGTSPTSLLDHIFSFRWRTATVPAGAVAASIRIREGFDARGVYAASLGDPELWFRPQAVANVVHRAALTATHALDSTRAEAEFDNVPQNNGLTSDGFRLSSDGEYAIIDASIGGSTVDILLSRSSDSAWDYEVTLDRRLAEIEQVSGTLYGAAGNTLYTIDPSTGVTTVVGSPVPSGSSIWAMTYVSLWGSDEFLIGFRLPLSDSEPFKVRYARMTLAGALVVGSNQRWDNYGVSNPIPHPWSAVQRGRALLAFTTGSKDRTVSRDSQMRIETWEADGNGFSLTEAGDSGHVASVIVNTGTGDDQTAPRFQRGWPALRASGAAVDRGPETVFQDDARDDIRTLSIRYLSGASVRVTATFAPGFSMSGKTLRVDGAAMPSAGAGPWDVDSGDGSVWTTLDNLSGGGTVGIEILSAGQSIAYGAWSDTTCCIESDHVTLENLTNDQLIQFEVWAEDGSGRSGSKAVGLTAAEAPDAPDAIPIVGTNTSGGVLLQWPE